jgi:hypothetical protein
MGEGAARAPLDDGHSMLMGAGDSPSKEGKMRAVLALLLLSSLVHADELIVTAKPNTWLLRDTTTTPISNLGRYSTAELCKQAITVVGKWRCDSSIEIDATLNCTASTAPTIPLVKNAEGNWQEPDLIVEEVGGKWVTRQELYVRAPAGAASCWVRGLADPDGWRLNGTTAPFLEMIVPGMPPVAEADNEQTPVEWTAALNELHENAVSVAIRALP